MERYLKKYGRSVYLSLPDGWRSKVYSAFLQPLRYKNKMYLDGAYTEIGTDRQGYYLYIGPPAHDLGKLSDGARLTVGGEQYRILRAETVWRGDTPFYVWAVVKSVSEVQK